MRTPSYKSTKGGVLYLCALPSSNPLPWTRAPTSPDNCKPMKTTELENLLAMAEKTQGWNFREWPPQRAQLTERCELIVIPPWLWRRRCGIARPSHSTLIRLRGAA